MATNPRTSDPEPAECPECGYSLIGLPRGRLCPECGKNLQVPKGIRDIRRGGILRICGAIQTVLFGAAMYRSGHAFTPIVVSYVAVLPLTLRPWRFYIGYAILPLLVTMRYTSSRVRLLLLAVVLDIGLIWLAYQWYAGIEPGCWAIGVTLIPFIAWSTIYSIVLLVASGQWVWRWVVSEDDVVNARE